MKQEDEASDEMNTLYAFDHSLFFNGEHPVIWIPNIPLHTGQGGSVVSFQCVNVVKKPLVFKETDNFKFRKCQIKYRWTALFQSFSWEVSQIYELEILLQKYIYSFLNIHLKEKNPRPQNFVTGAIFFFFF